MEKVLGIFVELHPNADIRDFHVDRNIRNDEKNFFSYGGSWSFSSDNDEHITKKVKNLSRKLRKLPQIGNEVTIWKNKIRIEVNKAVDDAEMIKAVAEVLRKHFGCDVYDVVIGKRDPAWDNSQRETVFDDDAEWREEVMY